MYKLFVFICALIIICVAIAIRIINLFYIRRTIRNLLIKLTHEFDQEGVEYWVDFGTLLGIMREKDVIIGDNDGDVCVLPSNKEKVERVVTKMGGRYFDWGAFRVYNGDIFIDIYVVNEDSSDYKNIEKYINPVQKETVSLGGHSFTASIPNKPTELLEDRYGKNWRTPVYNWYFLYFNFSGS